MKKEMNNKKLQYSNNLNTGFIWTSDCWDVPYPNGKVMWLVRLSKLQPSMNNFSYPQSFVVGQKKSSKILEGLKILNNIFSVWTFLFLRTEFALILLHTMEFFCITILLTLFSLHQQMCYKIFLWNLTL